MPKTKVVGGTIEGLRLGGWLVTRVLFLIFSVQWRAQSSSYFLVTLSARTKG